MLLRYRSVGRSENLGVPVLFGGHNLPPWVKIGLTDLPKFGGAMAPLAPPGTTGTNEESWEVPESTFSSISHVQTTVIVSTYLLSLLTQSLSRLSETTHQKYFKL